jgi:hypothetical protein
MACQPTGVRPLFSIATISLRRLYVLFFIHYKSRRAFVGEIATNPTQA